MSSFEREMPIFTKTFDFVIWLTPLTHHFPRIHQHTITLRLLNATLDFQETILVANGLRGEDRLRHLVIADQFLSKVRLYLRYVHRWRWISPGQYEHASRMIAEIGRLLGGWKLVTEKV